MKFDKEFKRAFSQGKVKVSQRGVRLATADTMDASLHIPQQHKICPRCGGRLSTDSGFDVCDDCGFDG